MCIDREFLIDVIKDLRLAVALGKVIPTPVLDYHERKNFVHHLRSHNKMILMNSSYILRA